MEHLQNNWEAVLSIVNAIGLLFFGWKGKLR